MGLNTIIIMGNLVAKPNIMYSNNGNGTVYSRFNVAVNNYNSKTQEQTVDFIACAAFGNIVHFLHKYFDKGSPIVVEGSLRQNNYVDYNGVKHYSYQVIANRVYYAGRKETQPETTQPAGMPQALPTLAAIPAVQPAVMPVGKPPEPVSPTFSVPPANLEELFGCDPGVELVLDDAAGDSA